jgi:hypothetical protein
MSTGDEWSPDGQHGTESFEQSDEARDETSRVDPDFTEDMESDPSLDPARQADERELEEAGAEFDDPEALVTLDGGMDDPDGLGGPTTRQRSQRDDEDGWDLDAPVTRDEQPDPDDQV